MTWEKVVQATAISACPKCGNSGFNLEPGYDVHDELVMVRCGLCGYVCSNADFMLPVKTRSQILPDGSD